MLAPLRFFLLTALTTVSLYFAAFTTAAHPARAANPSPENAPSASPLAWPEITREAKPWTRWWWLGSAVDKENITRELTAFAAAGLGGVEITPIYGARGAEDRFIPFLSPKYVELLAHASAEAKRLGLAVDMATGTGWPFGGGPHITPAEAELKIEIKDGAFAPVPTDFKVKRAAPGGEGLVLDPYSPRALEHYLKRFDEALAPLPPGAIHGQFHDSFEYTANWTPELPEKFRAMHGYALADHIAELTGTGDPDTIARIKSDYRETLGQLHIDYMRTWGDWVRKHGGVVRNQAHGAPSNLLDLYALADIPETEVFGATKFPIPGVRSTPGELSYNDPQPLVNRFASSAAHVAGRQLVSSETFTWLREHFHEAPAQMKAELDQLFLTGINHVFYHGTAYSPADAPWPGWLFYASTQYNDRNPLWRDLGDGLNAYIARCQSLLQSGQPDNDILVYWPFHDLLHQAEGWERKFSMHGRDWLTDSSTGKLAQQLVDKGYQFDFISDAQLVSLDRNRRGTIIVPQTKLMPVATLQTLRALAEKGTGVLFIDALPNDVPGYGKLSERRAAFKTENEKTVLHENRAGMRAALIGDGFFALESSETISAVLTRFAEPMVKQGLSFIRRIDDGDLTYFVTNLSAKSFDDWVLLRNSPYGLPPKHAALFDARTGQNGIGAMRIQQPEEELGYEVRLQLAPGESIFIRTFTQFSKQNVTIPAWRYLDPAGPATALAGDAPSASDQSRIVPSEATGSTNPKSKIPTWRVTFLRGGPELPPAFTLPATKLASWTDQSPEHERFAGTARYELTFDLPTAPAEAGGDWLLDLGDVRETARVFINGTEIDLLWSVPFRTRIDARYLKPGANTLAIEVTNLAANRVRDLDKRGMTWANFYDANIVNVNYKKMDAAAWPVMPSGLLGPVTLTPLKK